MNVTRLLANVFVIPEHAGRQNVVRRVHWILRFEKNGFHSNAFVETFLDIENLQNYIPANEIGNERVLQWAFDAQGGENFVAQIQPYHDEQIEHQIQCAGQEVYTDGFEVITQSPPGHIPSAVV